ncbi:MAG: hypothetical protein R3C05_29885 [Pirellulaceae bacterium]
MPKPSVVTIAAFATVAIFQIQPVTAQHWHGHGHGVDHHNGHGHFHGHYYDDHYSVHDYSYDYPDSYHGHAPIAHGYVDIPLNRLHGEADMYCPDDVGCPLEYYQPAFGGFSQPISPYLDAPYFGAPRQNQIPNGVAGNEHGHHANDGHDHGDHSHDGHSHGPVNPNSQDPAATFGTPDRQPMTAPTLPNRNEVPDRPRYETPRDCPAPPSSPPTDDGPIRMDGPPPSVTALRSPSLTVS